MAAVYILTLLSQSHKQKGRFAFSVDIVPTEKKDSIIKEREKQTYTDDRCLTGAVSPSFAIPKVNNTAIFKFTIGGPLKASFAPGENELEYKTKGRSEARREFVAELIPDSKDTIATITFTLNGKFVHKVTVTDICQPGMSRSMSTSSSYAEVNGASLPDSISSDIWSFSIDDNDTQSGSDFYDDGRTNYSNTKQEASPLPRSGPKVLSATSNYHRMINDSSLATLVSVLSPSDVSQLISHLGITTVQYQTIVQNHPHNILAANKVALIAWRNTGGSDSWENSDNSRRLVEQLLGALAQIGRNDVMKGLETVMESPRALKKEDFQHA